MLHFKVSIVFISVACLLSLWLNYEYDVRVPYVVASELSARKAPDVFGKADSAFIAAVLKEVSVGE